ncbi:hypothetical protein PsorP6_000583 [Peronosclerospora sorghi]|uniref:Uncharacterized protein n=1 Tax=Peronosclerospora sorghi TaxID=230839 RepID=A0ACC0WT68_9STRA|nr:hypothetical protein PsorP6_000583 [Peronosclerospora sorghi]
MPINFKVTFANGTSMKLMGLPDDVTLDGLHAHLFEKTSILPQDQHIMTGYPPKLIEGPGESTLTSLGVRTGSVLVLKEAPETNDDAPAKSTSVFIRRAMPADNSCLFHSIGYALTRNREGMSSMMRNVIKDTIRSNPAKYSEVFLGRPVSEYCAWILDDKSWGGEIELSILSTHYKVEIVVFDVTSMSRLCYGEDQGFTQRMFLLYDGIHYDLVVESPSTSASERQDVTLFAINDFAKVERASEVAVEAHQKHEFTDVSRFSLMCMVCRGTFVGQVTERLHILIDALFQVSNLQTFFMLQKEALAHSEATGHQQFGELHPH